MADLKYYDIILKPVITEQSMSEMSDKKYAFYVHPDATKNQIREAVEKMFDGAKVDKVNTMNLKGKLRRTRTMKYGRTAARKKAIVKLTPESKEIEVFAGM
ncbi:MAG: 50S ribosomal protein L23 [Defluviitaleaceae bacterium]|nr:50S ribosomal protein L23 [Defluviitaleaceae bacterium]MCL2836685.1 50S ribosomal protein L23 [Defluviitaleaceae bacterium]